MKGSTPPQIAEIIIKLVKDMAAVRTPLKFFRLSLSLYWFQMCAHQSYLVLPRVISQMPGPE